MKPSKENLKDEIKQLNLIVQVNPAETLHSSNDASIQPSCFPY